MNNQQISAVILAGGKSTRMGRDKASLPWGKQDILHHIIDCLQKVSQDILVISNQPRFLPTPIRVISDIIPHCGPLSGIHTGLSRAKHSTALVIGCDMPFITPEAVQAIMKHANSTQYDAIIPLYHGKCQPLFACYQKRSLPVIEKALYTGNYKMSSLCNLLHSFYIPEDMWPPDFNLEVLFKNLNYNEEYQQAYIENKRGE